VTGGSGEGSGGLSGGSVRLLVCSFVVRPFGAVDRARAGRGCAVRRDQVTGGGRLEEAEQMTRKERPTFEALLQAMGQVLPTKRPALVRVPSQDDSVQWPLRPDVGENKRPRTVRMRSYSSLSTSSCSSSCSC